MVNKFILKSSLPLMMSGILLAACSDNDSSSTLGGLAEEESQFGKANDVFTASEWYPGGEMGTTERASYSAIAPGAKMMGLETNFNKGEDFFEHLYTYTDEPRKGLGPAWIRSSCLACHPSYGHGKRQTEYRANTIGNGYLLVIYHPVADYTEDGVRYTMNGSNFISEVTGMPQTKAMEPFKAPVDENQITIDWKKVEGTMPSGLPLKFPDGEAFELIYPEVTIPVTAFNTNPKPTNYEVRLESTIGIYGTGLLDAISTEDMKAQYAKEAAFATLNPSMWNTAANDWAESAYYTLADGTKAIKKFTYAMTRASLQDGPGANAVWNITNVTRSDRRYLYSTTAWAKAMSEDPDVISYIRKNGANKSSLVHPYYAETDEQISEKVFRMLDMNTAAKGGDNYTAAFGEHEMNDKDYYDFMVWHRGLAVPAARNLDDPKVQRGKTVFNQIGCAMCHRPSWQTKEDNYWADNSLKAYAKANGLDANNILPKFAYQTIWPYTDLVQHRLYMENDIRTGWCRTTPLWGRGLSLRLTGAEDRLHDCRARNEIEAIMWHGYSKQSDAFFAVKNFYNLSKSDRDALVKFLRSI